MLYFSLFVVLAIIGGLDTGYLVYKRKKSEAPVCPLKGDCSFVLNSKYNMTMNVHNDVIGLWYFVCVLVYIGLMSAFPLYRNAIPEDSMTPLALAIGLGALGVLVGTMYAFGFTLRLLYLQFFVIKKMCFWCVLSSICIIGMFSIILGALLVGSANMN